MDRRDWLLTSLALPLFAPALSEGRRAHRAFLLPCLNQQTTLNASFESECSGYRIAGFHCIELWLPKLRALGLTATKTASMLHNAGLAVASACSLEGRLADSKTDFNQHLHAMEPELEFAQAVGAPRIVMTSFSHGNGRPDDYKIAVERLALVGELASRYKMRIALEFLAGSKLFGCLPTTVSAVRSAAQSNVGVCLDAFHFFVGISKIKDLDGLEPGDIEHVHFHDAQRSIPRERLADADRLPPGEGLFALDVITSALRRIRYKGALSVELFGDSFHNGDPRLVAERCYRALQSYTES